MDKTQKLFANYNTFLLTTSAFVVCGSVIGVYLHFFSSNNVKKRVVTFKPNIEGIKFERRPCTNSNFIETTVSDLLSKQVHKMTDNYVEKIGDIDENFAFVIRNVLTANECESIISAAEKTGFVSRGFVGKGADSASCCFVSDRLTKDLVYERIKALLPKKSYFDGNSSLTLKELQYYSSNNNQIIETFGKLSCLHPKCRIEKYKETQHLKVHRDQCVLVPETNDTFTVYAILIYLSDNYVGGSTRFCVDFDAKNKEFGYKFLDFKGKKGDALVFRHEILHKGGKVEEGTKYILRLDAAYQTIK